MSKKYPPNLRALIVEEKERHKRSIDSILKRENIINLVYALDRRIKQAFSGCNVTTNCMTNIPFITLHLISGYNVTKNVFTFLEDNEQLLNTIGGSDYKAILDPDAGSYDISWTNLRIYVYYGSGNCRRVLTGVEKVEKPIYKLECF